MTAATWRSFEPAGDGASLQRVSTTLGNPADYADRNGYDPSFLPGLALPLPGLGAWEGDAAPLFDEALIADNDDRHELRYRNFSVKVSRSRRLPLFSAVNIDGARSNRAVKRTNVWKYDPRISTDYQVLREAYGEEARGLFSRGHMTRREDPNWGEDFVLLRQSDADTFHATNAAPQRQRFNGGIWLALEDYVLDSSDNEQIRATVLTGPVFDDDDPDYFGVKVPIEFWKIVIFFHPIFEAYRAIAYKRSQASYLPRRARAAAARFVFGDFQDTQVSIASLAEETGLNFSVYEPLDVMRGAARGLSVRLSAVEDAFLSP
jgi:endonuclease G